MRPPRPFEAAGTPRLLRRVAGDHVEWWTETVGKMPAVYGERWASLGERSFRSFDPSRSKLAAGLARGWDGPLPAPGESWLYLGAASGTTVSHVADLVGPAGTVFAVEKSPRPFARLVAVAERWPNLLPLLDDAREPENYLDLVAPVDGIYADVAQPDQAGIVLRNAEYFLAEPSGSVVLALKLPSLGRERGPLVHLRDAETRLGAEFALAASVRLEPFHRGHYLLGGSRTTASRAGRPTSRGPPSRLSRTTDARDRPGTRLRPRRAWNPGPRRR